MPEYTLSGKADKDLAEIYRFSYQKFGETRADEYLLGIEERFSQLAQQPFLGRRIDHTRRGYFRYEYKSHSIFYKQTEKGIIIIRVLHKHMDVKRHV